MITTITIPLRLVSEANSREHWHKAARRHTQQKMVVKAYLNNADINESHVFKCFRLPGYFQDKEQVTVTLTRAAPRPFDSDNLQSSFKYIRDFLAEWITGIEGAGKADSDPRITWKYNQIKTKNKEYFIVIELANS